jgi:hypothetical protein
MDSFQPEWKIRDKELTNFFYFGFSSLFSFFQNEIVFYDQCFRLMQSERKLTKFDVVIQVNYGKDNFAGNAIFFKREWVLDVDSFQE